LGSDNLTVIRRISFLHLDLALNQLGLSIESCFLATVSLSSLTRVQEFLLPHNLSLLSIVSNGP
jgi:hypothetical protein